MTTSEILPGNPGGKTDPGISGPAEAVRPTIDLDQPTLHREEKVFANLRAAFVMRGHALHRTHPADGPVTYLAERWGLVRYLPSIDAARRFFEVIGGRL